MRAPPGGGGGEALPVFFLTIIGLGLAPGFSTFFVKSSGVRPILRPFVFAIDVEGNSIGVQYLVPVRYYLVAPPPRAAGPSRERAPVPRFGVRNLLRGELRIQRLALVIVPDLRLQLAYASGDRADAAGRFHGRSEERRVGKE